MLLWLVPLGTTFTFFMFLRDVYQHSNADDGRLTNSRVFFTDFFTRWAVFVYGQDMHIPHHLFPAVPHYRLEKLHELLKKEHDVYRSQVVETHGTFRDEQGRPTILDEMTRLGGRWPSPRTDSLTDRRDLSRCDRRVPSLSGEEKADRQNAGADDARDDAGVEAGEGW